MEVVMITGMSGAGKTQAVRCLEDQGYLISRTSLESSSRTSAIMFDWISITDRDRKSVV